MYNDPFFHCAVIASSQSILCFVGNSGFPIPQKDTSQDFPVMYLNIPYFIPYAKSISVFLSFKKICLLV